MRYFAKNVEFLDHFPNYCVVIFEEYSSKAFIARLQ